MTKTPKIRMYIVNKRQALGLSMRETSRLLHMDFHYYYRIENGLISRVNFLTLCRIARILDISLNDLCYQETVYQAKEQ